MGERKKQNRTGLVLQGGGATGAFTCGALLRLLEDPRINISAVTGASSGAMNGLCLAAGATNKERAQLLHKLWKNVSLNTFPMRSFSDSPLLPDALRWPNLPFFDAYLAGNHEKAEMPLPLRFLVGALKKTFNSKQIWQSIRTSEITFFSNAAEENPITGELTHFSIEQEKINAELAASSAALLSPAYCDGKKLHDGAKLYNPHMGDIEQEDLTDMIVITLHGIPKIPVRAEPQEKTARATPAFKRNAAVKKAEIHGHLAHLLNQPNRSFKLHEIAFIAPRHYRDSARLNNSGEHVDRLRKQGYKAADQWLKENGHLLGRADTYTPPSNVIGAKRQLRVA
jgi:NTE family protein